jgi:hypothetical protein
LHGGHQAGVMRSEAGHDVPLNDWFWRKRHAGPAHFIAWFARAYLVVDASHA